MQSHSEWPLQLIRVYLASGYFSSGMCKLLCGARFGRFWGKGTTLRTLTLTLTLTLSLSLSLSLSLTASGARARRSGP